MAFSGLFTFLTYLPCIFTEHNLNEKHDEHQTQSNGIQLGIGNVSLFLICENVTGIKMEILLNIII